MLPYLTLFGALFDCLNPVIKNIMIITIYISHFSFHITLREYTSALLLYLSSSYLCKYVLICQVSL